MSAPTRKSHRLGEFVPAHWDNPRGALTDLQEPGSKVRMSQQELAARLGLGQNGTLGKPSAPHPQSANEAERGAEGGLCCLGRYFGSR